jgi:hypothetical protein
MSVDRGLIVLERDVTSEREHLDLLIQRNLAVSLRLPVKPAEGHVTESADRREPSRADPLLATPGGQSRDDFIAAREDQRNSAAMLAAR